MVVPPEACLSFVSTGVRKRERGDIRQREKTCVAIARRIGGLLLRLYILPVFTVS